MRRGFTQTYVPLYYGLEYHIPEMLPQFVGDLGVHSGPSVEHCYEETFYSQVRINAALYQTDCLQQLAKTFKGEEFRLYRNDYRICCRE